MLYYFQVSAKKAKLVSIATQTIFYLVKLFNLGHKTNYYQFCLPSSEWILFQGF